MNGPANNKSNSPALLLIRLLARNDGENMPILNPMNKGVKDTPICLLYLQNDKYLLRFFWGQPEGLQRPVISRRGKQKITEDVGVRNLQDFRA